MGKSYEIYTTAGNRDSDTATRRIKDEKIRGFISYEPAQEFSGTMEYHKRMSRSRNYIQDPRTVILADPNLADLALRTASGGDIPTAIDIFSEGDVQERFKASAIEIATKLKAQDHKVHLCEATEVKTSRDVILESLKTIPLQ